MSLMAAQMLRNLAMGQATVVAPPLGESYAGKSAGTISAMLLMLATDLEREAAQAGTYMAWLMALVTSARPADEALAADIARAAAALDRPHGDHWDQLMALLTRLHAWADDHDPRLAADCREFLADWAGFRLLQPPVPPSLPRGPEPSSA
ncbi:hypothetical protein [Thermaurantiacus sp.]